MAINFGSQTRSFPDRLHTEYVQFFSQSGKAAAIDLIKAGLPRQLPALTEFLGNLTTARHDGAAGFSQESEHWEDEMGGTPGEDRSDDLVHKVEELIEQHSLTQSETKNVIDRFILGVGSILSWGAVILIAVIILQVVLRYGFRHGLVVLEESQWHLYSIGVMFGLSFAQVKDSHIRVDIVHMRLSERTQRIFEILGILFLLLPFCWVVFYSSMDFLADSWRVNERSDAPIGLCCRWGIKAVIPLSIAMLALAAISRLAHDFMALYRGAEKTGTK